MIERAEVPASSEIHDRELTECIRESALTVTFPKHIPTGHRSFELTLRIEPSPNDLQ